MSFGKASVIPGKSLPYLILNIDTVNLNVKEGKTLTPGHMFIHVLRHAECELEAGQRLNI